MMPIRYYEDRFVQRLVPRRRVLWITAILAFLVPTVLALGLQEAKGVALSFSFELVFLGLILAIWAMGLLMAASWLHAARIGRPLALWLDRFFLVVWLTSPLAFLVILTCRP
jgi:hypothetical protein